MRTLELSCHLDAPAEEVWARATSFGGVNDELLPVLRMTWPRELAGIDTARAPLGTRLCRSWLLLFGVLPVGFDDVTLVELGERRFVEDSAMTGMRRWRHERTVTPDGDGCTVTDRLTFEPQVRPIEPLVAGVVRLLFRHRHRRLRLRRQRAAM